MALDYEVWIWNIVACQLTDTPLVFAFLTRAESQICQKGGHEAEVAWLHTLFAEVIKLCGWCGGASQPAGTLASS